MKVRGLIGLIAAIVAPFLLFDYLKYGSHHMDMELVYHRGHFYVVSIVSVLATVLGVAVGIAGGRLRNIKVSFLALAFISLAGIFSIHGLATPGFLINAYELPGFAAQLSILVATFWLWLSSLSSDNRVIELLSRRQNRLVPVWTLVLAACGVGIMLFPHAADMLIENMGSTLNKSIVSAVVLILNTLTIRSYFRSYRYSKFPLQIAIVYCSGWFIVSQMIMVLADTWKISWWLYHFLLLFSVIVMLIGLFKQYSAHSSIAKGFQALFTTDPVERMTNCLSPSVKALILATESRDTYTAGHNFRVTLYSLRIGEALALQPEQLRALVQGTIVHDVGKINIADAILNKPGKLTAEEREVIEQHPAKGYEMCKNLGFLKEELSIIRSHHEKWDGTGYPEALQGKNIPLMARIAAVADVYDALTSHRAYRQAWSHEDAVKFLNDQKGTHFDPDIVEAWVRVCDRDPGVYLTQASLMQNEAAPA